MLRALAECGIRPDVILGTSVGAINGAFFAADPTLAGVERLTELWRAANLADRSPGTVLRRVTTLARSGTHLQSLSEMRDRLTAVLPVRTVEELSIPFQCVAASIELTGSTVTGARVALAAVAPVPLLVEAAADAVIGAELTPERAQEAGARAAAACSPISDARGTTEYRREVVAVLVPRALRIAWLRATGSWPEGVCAPCNGVVGEDVR